MSAGEINLDVKCRSSMTLFGSSVSRCDVNEKLILQPRRSTCRNSISRRRKSKLNDLYLLHRDLFCTNCISFVVKMSAVIMLKKCALKVTSVSFFTVAWFSYFLCITLVKLSAQLTVHFCRRSNLFQLQSMHARATACMVWSTNASRSLWFCRAGKSLFYADYYFSRQRI